MFFKKPDPNPLGVPLGELHSILQQTTLNSELKKNSLEVTYEKLKAVLTVEKPLISETPDTPIQAIVKVRTYLPKELRKLCSNPEFMNLANSMTTFAALTEDRSGIYLGSRLTIYEDETGWNVYFPLLLYSLITTNEIFNHSLRILLGQDERSNGVSKWTDEDFDLTQSYLKNICVCTTGGLGFTAEFGIGPDSVAAIRGDQTALWRMLANQAHPAMGGGLFCILELPFGFEKEKLLKIINILNAAEMEANDLPPHFGAWSIGNRGDNPAYVSFLPNIMHSQAKNIQVNMSIWAHQRVQSAYTVLLSHGYI